MQTDEDAPLSLQTNLVLTVTLHSCVYRQAYILHCLSFDLPLLSFSWVVEEREIFFSLVRYTHRNLLQSPMYRVHAFTISLFLIPSPGILTTIAFSWRIKPLDDTVPF